MDIRAFLLKTASDLDVIANSLEFEAKTASLGLAPNEMEEIVGTFGDKSLEAIEFLNKKQSLSKQASFGEPISNSYYREDSEGLNEYDLIHLDGGI